MFSKAYIGYFLIRCRDAIHKVLFPKEINPAYLIGLMMLVFTFIIVSPAYAFEPIAAAKKTLDLAKYIIVAAAVIGAIRALSRAQVLSALAVVICAVVIFQILDPTAFKALGTGILSYFNITSGSSGSGAPTADLGTTPASGGTTNPTVEVQPAPATAPPTTP